jgi:fatty acid desaturase
MSTSTDFPVFSPTALRTAPPPSMKMEDENTAPSGTRKLAVDDEARGTILKYKADRGPVSYVLAMFALHVVLWLYASPLVAVLSVVPLAVASMFVAPINHHHQHLNTFRSSWVNRVYDLALSLQTGVAPYGWTLHHNLGHHINYLNQHPHVSPDESAWTRRDGTQMSRVGYTIDMLLRHQADMYQVGLRYPRYMKYWVLMKLPLYALIASALWVNWANTLLIFLIPGFLALTHTIWATYEHHAGCPTDNHLVGSRNRESRMYNWLTGNLGLHTAHHKRPGVHWSLLPQVHEEIKDQIPAELKLESFW